MWESITHHPSIYTTPISQCNLQLTTSTANTVYVFLQYLSYIMKSFTPPYLSCSPLAYHTPDTYSWDIHTGQLTTTRGLIYSIQYQSLTWQAHFCGSECCLSCLHRVCSRGRTRLLHGVCNRRPTVWRRAETGGMVMIVLAGPKSILRFLPSPHEQDWYIHTRMTALYGPFQSRYKLQERI